MRKTGFESDGGTTMYGKDVLQTWKCHTNLKNCYYSTIHNSRIEHYMGTTCIVFKKLMKNDW